MVVVVVVFVVVVDVVLLLSICWAQNYTKNHLFMFLITIIKCLHSSYLLFNQQLVTLNYSEKKEKADHFFDGYEQFSKEKH